VAGRCEMTGEGPATSEATLQASEYAWKWFEYHSSQRQTVFQFFLAIIGAILAGYFAIADGGQPSLISPLFGLLICVLSFLFWRLDCRGLRLVKIAERYLIEDENRLAAIVGEKIKLVASADLDKGKYPLLEKVHSFRQVYQCIFALIGLLGLVMLLTDIVRLVVADGQMNSLGGR
jgi:hypothetical protein